MRAVLEAIKAAVTDERERATGQVAWDVLPGGIYREVAVPMGDSARDHYDAWEAPFGWCAARFREGGGRWARRSDAGAGWAYYRFEAEVTALLFKLWL